MIIKRVFRYDYLHKTWFVRGEWVWTGEQPRLVSLFKLSILHLVQK